MSGAQGTQPPGTSPTRTTYESVEGGENRTAMDLYSTKDEGGIQIEKEQDKAPPEVTLPASRPVGATEEKNKEDIGVTGTG